MIHISDLSKRPSALGKGGDSDECNLGIRNSGECSEERGAGFEQKDHGCKLMSVVECWLGSREGRRKFGLKNQGTGSPQCRHCNRPNVHGSHWPEVMNYAESVPCLQSSQTQTGGTRILRSGGSTDVDRSENPSGESSAGS